MTVVDIDLHNYTIIPYQELLGNYDGCRSKIQT